MHRNTPPPKALELALVTAGAAHLHPPLALLGILLAAEALRRLRALVMQLPSVAGTPRVGIQVAALTLFQQSLLDFKDDLRLLPLLSLRLTGRHTDHTHRKQTPERKR